MASRLPAGIAKQRKAYGAKLHKGRQIEASCCANAEDMRSRVLRKRYPLTIAVVGPQGSGKSALIANLAANMSAGVPEECVPTQTGTGVNETVVYTRSFAVSLIDTPGDPAQRREVLSALTLADGVILVVSGDAKEWHNSTKTEEWQEYIKLIRATDHFMTVLTIINKVEGANALSNFMRAAMPLRRFLEKTLYGSTAAQRSQLKRAGMGNYNPIYQAKSRIFFGSATTGLGISEPWNGAPEQLRVSQDRLGGDMNGRNGTFIRFLNGFGDKKTHLQCSPQVKKYYMALQAQPLRVLIDDVYYNDGGDSGSSGWVAVGKVISGTINVGESVSITPGNVMTVCTSIKFHNSDPKAPNKNVNQAVARERVEITMGEQGCSANMITAGSVMGKAAQGTDAPQTVTEFEANVRVLADAKFSIDVKQANTGSLFRGEETTEQPFDFPLGAYPAYFDKILGLVNPNTGRLLKSKKAVESVGPGQTGKVTVRLSGEGIPLDEYSKFRDTGRFLVRGDNGQGTLVAVGKITGIDWM